MLLSVVRNTAFSLINCGLTAPSGGCDETAPDVGRPPSQMGSAWQRSHDNSRTTPLTRGYGATFGRRTLQIKRISEFF